MAFQEFEVSTPHVAYLCLGGFVVLFGMFSLLLREKMYIGEACWAFLFGVVIGPYGINVFNPRAWGDGSDATIDAITLEFTRVVLAIGVFAIGVELPKAYVKSHWKSLFFMLAPVMAWGWFVAAAFIYALIPGLNFLSSLCVAACLTPTDPILAAAVVGGKYADKNVPAHVRHLLAAECGCNDGAAYPFLFLSLYLIMDGSVGAAVKDWVLLLWLYQIILGVILGSFIGVSFRYLMKFCERHELIDRHSYVAQYVSLAMLTVGIVVLLGSDDLLAAFSCGSAFAWDGFFNRQTEEAVFSSVIDLLFNIASFVYLGAWMPFGSFGNKEWTLEVWRLLVIAVLVLLLKRLPIVIVLYKWIPDVKTFREAVFSGHFGPMGVGAVFISTLAAGILNDHIEELDATTPGGAPAQTRLLAQTIQPICAFLVICSITIHGLSIPGFSLSRRIHTVTKTLSRHTAHGPHVAPEWTTQTRHVVRGDQAIPINEDPEHLRGDEIDRAERGEVEKHGEDSFRDSILDADPRPADEGSIRAFGHAAADRNPHTEENERSLPTTLPLPETGGTVEEWQEGPHRVIERRRGPGEEVEVEVIRDWFYRRHDYGDLHLPHLHHLHRSLPHVGHPRKYDQQTDATRSSGSDKSKEAQPGGQGQEKHDDGHAHHQHERKFFRGSSESVRKEVREYLTWLEHKAKRFEEEVKDGMTGVVSKWSESAKHPEEQSEGLSSFTEVFDDDDEEGWASDRSNPMVAAPVIRVSNSSGSGSKSRLPKARTSTKRNKRTSIRRGPSYVARSRSQAAAETEQRDEEESRGRARLNTLSSSTNDHRPSGLQPRPRQSRLDSIRGMQSMPSSALSSREHSPARSIRFFDELPRSGFATPRRGSGTSTPRFDTGSVPGTPPNLD
ncbi:hypothetical protein VKT23_009595 [Stygiomarasmius scandens]|uniref:Cation/H+ exchanger transmembrane domain-containing protein n=1 Tax=Marasmiellus scandens TaxID=2682957 RepID=A0ABR1IZ11_9AGAR